MKLDDWEYVEVAEFQERMRQRLEMGREQYGMDYLEKDNMAEIEAELLDIANYALLEFLKIRNIRRIRDEVTGKINA